MNTPSQLDLTPSQLAELAAVASRTVADRVGDALKVAGLSNLRKAAEATTITYASLRRRMANPGDFTIRELALIAAATDTTVLQLAGGAS